jgi:hypothetical protein
MKIDVNYHGLQTSYINFRVAVVDVLLSFKGIIYYYSLFFIIIIIIIIVISIIFRHWSNY